LLTIRGIDPVIILIKKNVDIQFSAHNTFLE
jgi:hypothetical protein